jgi:hypothetical protein
MELVISNDDGWCRCYFNCGFYAYGLNMDLLPEHVEVEAKYTRKSGESLLWISVIDVDYMQVNFDELTNFIAGVGVKKIRISGPVGLEVAEKFVPVLSRYLLECEPSYEKVELLSLFNIDKVISIRLTKEEQEKYFSPFKPRSLRISYGGWFDYEPYYECVTELQLQAMHDEYEYTKADMKLVSKFVNLQTLLLLRLHPRWTEKIPPSVTKLRTSMNHLGWPDIVKLYERGVRVIETSPSLSTDFKTNRKNYEKVCCDLRIYVNGELWFGKQNRELIEKL